LEKLIKSGRKPFLVITGQDKLVGRKQTLTPPPVKITAQNFHIPVAQPEKIINHKSEILNLKPDLIIVAAYGHILPKEILDIPQYGCLNVHPSLLPKYRGPSPIQSTILSGDEKTGVTIMRMTEKLDAGPILSQKEITVSEKENSQTLHDKLAEVGAELLIQVLPKLFAGTLTQQLQDDSKATYTKILTKDDSKIDWQKPAKDIERQIRALNPEPGVYTNYAEKILKILEADVLSIQSDKQTGEAFLTKDRKLTVQTGQNCLVLQKLQLEGGKPLSAQDFLQGHRDFIGMILK
jgi:methionyl-tRNA formyltransferase